MSSPTIAVCVGPAPGQPLFAIQPIGPPATSSSAAAAIIPEPLQMALTPAGRDRRHRRFDPPDRRPKEVEVKRYLVIAPGAANDLGAAAQIEMP